MYSIRNISTADKIGWIEMAHDLWPSIEAAELEVLFDQLLKDLSDTSFVILEGEHLLGFMNLSVRHDYVEGSATSPVAYVEGIYVKPEHRRKGVGKLLIDEAAQWGRGRGCSELGSDAEVENEASHRFHTEAGFEEAGRIVSFIKQI